MPITGPGTIRSYDGCILEIEAPFEQDWIIKRQYIRKCEILLEDGRSISPRQRRYIYAMLRDISYYTGHETEFLKDHFKAEWAAQTGGEPFSLSDCTVTQANPVLHPVGHPHQG